MWDVTVPVTGRCRECGEELGTLIKVRATQAWADQYRADEWMRRRINRAVVRLVVARHERVCLGHTHPALTHPALAAGA